MNGKEIINHIVREEMPDFDRVRAICLNSPTTQKVTRLKLMPTAAAAVAAVLLLTISVAAVVMGGFDVFISRFNPTFGEVVLPVEMYVVENDIRLEVIAAQTFGNQVIAYISVRDISGQNRITESVSFLNLYKIRLYMLDETGNELVSGFGTLIPELLHFDDITNTAYFELIFFGEPGTMISDRLRIHISEVVLSHSFYNFIPMDIDLSAIGEVRTIMHPVSSDVVQLTTIERIYELGFRSEPVMMEILAPGGHFADFPHDRPGQWISNIGIVDGRLQILLAHDVTTHNLSWPNVHVRGGCIYLSNSFEDSFMISLFGDENHEFQPNARTPDADTAIYYFLWVFDVDLNDLANYSVEFSGHYFDRLSGNWQITTQTEYTGVKTRIGASDVMAGGLAFENYVLTPLGLQVSGSGIGLGGGIFWAVLETDTGVVELGFHTSNATVSDMASDRHYFSIVWLSESPIDVPSVKTVFVNGVRIAVD